MIVDRFILLSFTIRGWHLGVGQETRTIRATENAKSARLGMRRLT